MNLLTTRLEPGTRRGWVEFSSTQDKDTLAFKYWIPNRLGLRIAKMDLNHNEGQRNSNRWWKQVMVWCSRLGAMLRSVMPWLGPNLFVEIVWNRVAWLKTASPTSFMGSEKSFQIKQKRNGLIISRRNCRKNFQRNRLVKSKGLTEGNYKETAERFRQNYWRFFLNLRTSKKSSVNCRKKSLRAKLMQAFAFFHLFF